MTPESQRIAIAEVCGYTMCGYTMIWQSDVEPDAWFGKPPKGIHKPYLPDYLNDLNAMHEAEKVLNGAQEQHYFEWLHETAGNLHFYRATASQRAEAFLRTLGLWKE